MTRELFLRDLIAITKYTHPAFCTRGGHWLVCIRNEQSCPYCVDPYITTQ